VSIKKICLRAVTASRDGKTVWTGEYACSICGLRFRPDPAEPAKLLADFSVHQETHASVVEK
jgi:hypothetical protein